MIRVSGTWRRLDTVQLEVAFAGHRELFARPGTIRFGEEPLEHIVPNGTIGDTALGSNVDLIFSRDPIIRQRRRKCSITRLESRRNPRHPMDASRDFVAAS